MTAPLLPTRLVVPTIRAARVARPRLIHRLMVGLNGQATLILATAGSGKTTLVVEWLGQAKRPAAWLSLEETDNDPDTFLVYLIAALKTVAQIDIEGQPLEPTPSFLTRVIAEIACQPGAMILVLDDLHVVTNPVVHRLLAFLLDHLPPNLHMVILSRETPAIPLARLRARGMLNEIRAADLHFTLDEARQLFNKIMNLSLSEEVIAALAKRTEGWAAGLQLFGLSLARVGATGSGAISDGRSGATGSCGTGSGATSDGRSATASGGSTGSGAQEGGGPDGGAPQGAKEKLSLEALTSEGERYVMEYLAEEMLQRQPEELQAFLLRTGMLDQFNAELCQEIMAPGGSTGSDTLTYQQLLENLERANLFISPLDGERRWFRYHALFTDFLRHSLERRAPGIARQINHRAAFWYAARGQIEEAIEYALRGADFTRATEWMDEAATQVFFDGRTWMLSGWIGRVPEEITLKHPRLLLFQVWSFFDHARPDLAIPLLQTIERQVAAESPGQGRPPLDAELAITHLILLVLLMRLDQAADLANELEASADPQNKLLTSVVSMVQALLIGNRSDPSEGIRRLDQVIEYLLTSGMRYLAMSAMCNKGDLLHNTGRFHAAYEAYQRALNFAAQQARTWPIAGWPNFLMGMIQYEWNDLQAAQQSINRGLELCLLMDNARMLAAARMALARLQWAKGDPARAMQTARQAVEDGTAPGVDETQRRELEIGRLDIHWLCGERAPFEQWVRENGPRWNEDPTAKSDEESLAIASGWLRLGEAGQALEIVAHLRGRPHHSARTLARLDVLEALALDQQGDCERADQLTRAAAARAESEEYIRLFVDENPTTSALLARACASETQPSAFLKRLLQATAQAPAIPERQPTGEQVLSPREIEILRLVAEGLTNQQIAKRLVVAPGTVKKHLDNIYTKLNASNRAQALVIARAKGIR